MAQFQYKKVLVVGATSGIGRALAAKFVETGTSVIVSGRRKEQLDDFVKEYGNIGKATVDTAIFDITDLKAIPQFAASQFKQHPDLDCVFFNAGIQRALDWTKPETVNLDYVEQEILTNYTANMHLTKAFLPHLQKQEPRPTSIIYTTSGLALIPATFCPNYSASKAAMHHMIIALRQQLRDANSNVKIIEVLPPAVQTELHDFESGEKGKHIGMPLKEFTEEAFEGLCKEGVASEQVPVGGAKMSYGPNGWETERQKMFAKMLEMWKQQK